MWKILGIDVLYIDIAKTWKDRIISLAGDDEKSRYFKDTMSTSDVMYIMNGTTEEHTFFIRISKDITSDGIQELVDVQLEILKNIKFPCIEVDGIKQKYQVIITNQEEPEIIGLNKTPGMSSGQVFKPIIDGLSSPGRLNSRFI